MPDSLTVDLLTLPVGTMFHVENGYWDGAIRELLNHTKGIFNYATQTYMPIDDSNRYTLVLSHIMYPT